MWQLGLWHPAPTGNDDAAVRDGPPEPAVDHWGRFFSGALQQPVALAFTANRTTMVSYRYTPAGVRLRLHRLFADGDLALMRDVLGFVRGDRAAGRRLDRYIEARAGQSGAPPPLPLRPRGDVHDLTAIFDEVNGAYFHGACRAAITWGARQRPRGQQSLQLGLYLVAYRLITLHPCLDQAFVPRFYVAWVTFHEMLHELFGLAHDRRRRLHPPDFTAVETSHPDHRRSRAWEAEHLPKLLEYRPPPGPPRGSRRRRLTDRGSLPAGA